MRFIFSHTSQYLAAAVIAALLQGVAAATPVFAEASEKTATAVTQAAATAAMKQKSAGAKQCNAKSKSGKTSSRPELKDFTPTSDHSAEYKPVKNEFLKEGEGIPGSEIPYYEKTRLSKEELAERNNIK